MKTYQYTSPENTVVHVIDEDGISRMSMLASAVPDGVEILPYVPPPAVIPASVTMRQARLVLLDAGLLDDIDIAIAAILDPIQKRKAQIEWEFSNEVQRYNGVVSYLGPALGLSELQIDQLFINAATL